MKWIAIALACMGIITLGVRLNQMNKERMRRYQLDVYHDAYYLYDGERLVGKIPFTGTTRLDSILIEDK